MVIITKSITKKILNFLFFTHKINVDEIDLYFIHIKPQTIILKFCSWLLFTNMLKMTQNKKCLIVTFDCC